MPEDHMDKLYNSPNPLVKYAHMNRLERIYGLLPSNIVNRKILDAGCGEGHLIERLYRKNSQNTYFGIYVTEIALVKARERCPYAEFRKEDILKTRFPEGFFDLVICTEVLEHIQDYQSALQELKRILKTGGYLIITFPNELLWTMARFLLRRRPVRVPDHVNSFRPKEIKSLMGMDLSAIESLPFGLPFVISLGCLIKFQK